MEGFASVYQWRATVWWDCVPIATTKMARRPAWVAPTELAWRPTWEVVADRFTLLRDLRGVAASGSTQRRSFRFKEAL
jgi:hypothetical protein